MLVAPIQSPSDNGTDDLFPLFCCRLSLHMSSRIKPLLKVHLEALEHLFFDVFDVGELAPTSDIAVFTGALNLHNEFLHKASCRLQESSAAMSSTLLGSTRLQEFFECFSWYEFDRLAALDLDLFAGLWIDARARLPCGNFKSPKTDYTGQLLTFRGGKSVDVGANLSS